MIRKTKTRAGKLRYGVRVHLGHGRYQWLGTFSTREKARQVEADWLLSRRAREMRTCRDFARFWLEGYAQRVKASSYDTARSSLRVFLRDFGERPLDAITHTEAERWAREQRWAVPVVVTMLNDAVEKQLLVVNPFKGLSKKGPGRRHVQPLTVSDVDRLGEIAGRLHGETMRAFILFTAYSGMRVGEVFALRWQDLDLERGRIAVRRRLYRGELDLPKSNRPRVIVLTPPARAALKGLDRSTEWIFPAKRGGQMTQSTLTYYWQGIVAAFGRSVTPHELKHFAGHYLYVTLGLPARVVAVQLAHAGPRLVEELYGHGDVGALQEIDAAFLTTDSDDPGGGASPQANGVPSKLGGMQGGVRNGPTEAAE
jgi:integrase